MPGVESKLVSTVKERQLDGLAPEPREQFLLARLISKQHALVAAERAELNELSTTPPQPVNASVAQDFPAVDALMRRARAGMPRTNQGTIGQHDRRSRAGHVEAGNGDRDLSGLDEKLDISQVQALAGRQSGFFDALAVDERTIGRSAVAHHDTIAPEHDFAMRGGHRGVVDLNIILRAAPKSIDTQVEFNHPILEPNRFYN